MINMQGDVFRLVTGEWFLSDGRYTVAYILS